MEISFSHSISGYVVGPIWMPMTECHKWLSLSVHNDETLRDAVLRATNDGDFRECRIADGVLRTTMTIRRGGRLYRRERADELTRFPSIADCVRADWCGPDFGEDD